MRDKLDFEAGGGEGKMRHRALAIACLFISSCSVAGNTEAEENARSVAQQGEAENPFAVATASRSLIFPFSIDAAENPPELTKVEGAEPSEVHVKDLMFAITVCAPGPSWFDRNSHWSAMVIPSSSSVVWAGMSEDRPTDSDIIECVRSWYPGTFFYALSEVGYDTSDASHYIQ